MQKWMFPLLCLLLTACSEDSDSEKFASRPPVFADIVCTPLAEGETQIRAGQSFVVTAQQERKGHLLNKSTYQWSDVSGQLSHKYVTSVIYDNQPANPTDTIKAPTAGSYKLTFKARYNASGNTSWWAQQYGSSFQTSLADNSGRVTYTTGGLFYFDVTVEKTITVLP